MKHKLSPIKSLSLAISAMMGRFRSAPAPATTGLVTQPPKDSYVNRPVIRPRTIGVHHIPQIGIQDYWASCQRTNQRKARKNARRALAAGNRKAFA